MNLLAILCPIFYASIAASELPIDYDFALQWAIRDNNVKLVIALLEDPRVYPSARDNEAIIMAAEMGHIYCLTTLLADLRVDSAARENLAICQAAKNGHTDCVRALITDMRVNSAARGNLAIVLATMNGHVECAAVLSEDPRVSETRWDYSEFDLAFEVFAL